MVKLFATRIKLNFRTLLLKNKKVIHIVSGLKCASNFNDVKDKCEKHVNNKRLENKDLSNYFDKK